MIKKGGERIKKTRPPTARLGFARSLSQRRLEVYQGSETQTLVRSSTWTTTASPLPHGAAVTGSATHFHVKCGAPGMEIAPAKPSVGTGCGAPHGKDWGLERGRGGRGRCHVDTKQVRTAKQSESVANVSPLIREPQIITEPSLTSFISSNKAERRPTRCTRLKLKRKPVPRLQKHTSAQFRGLFYHTTAIKGYLR